MLSKLYYLQCDSPPASTDSEKGPEADEFGPRPGSPEWYAEDGG